MAQSGMEKIKERDVKGKIVMKQIKFMSKGSGIHSWRIVKQIKPMTGVKRPTEKHFSSSSSSLHNCVIEPGTTALYQLISFPQWSVQYLSWSNVVQFSNKESNIIFYQALITYI